MSHVSHPCEGCGRQWPGQKSFKEIFDSWGCVTEERILMHPDTWAQFVKDNEEWLMAEKKVNNAFLLMEIEADGQRTKRKYVLDPRSVIISVRQQTEIVSKHASVDGGPHGESEIKKVGKPVVVLSAELIGQDNYPVSEPPPQLDIDISKIANVITFKFLWDGKQVAEYDVTEQAMLTEEFRHHVDSMIKRAVRSIVDLGYAITSYQVHTHLERAAGMQFGTAWMNSTLSQPLTLSKDG